MNILAFAGSLRKDSLNRKLLSLAVETSLQKGVETEIIDLKDYSLPAYNEDIEHQGMPENALKLKEKVVSHSAIILSSPEYNHSIPGHLKNTFDWVSRFRPMPWSRKIVLLLSASPSAVGGNRALWQLRVPFESNGAHVFPDMFSLASADRAFDSNGRLLEAKLSERLQKNVEGFLQFAKALS